MTIFESEPIALYADLALGARRGWGRKLGFDPVAAWKLRRKICGLDPDAVVAHGGESLKYVALTAPRKTKVVYYKIGTSRVQMANPLRRLAYRFFIDRADLVAGVSHEMVDEARDVFGASPDVSFYAPNGRDPKPFGPWRGSSESAVRFVFVGHMTRTKRPELFVEVIQQLSSAGIDVQGVLVGDGPMLEQIREKCRETPVSVLGRREDVADILSTSDVFVFTSLAEGEGMPGVLIEASLAGLPVLTTDVPGARTVINDGVTGIVVPIDHLETLVAAARRLAGDATLRRSMGEAGRERAVTEFTLEASVSKWEHLLGSITDSRSARDLA